MPVDFGEGEYSFLNESRWWKWSFCWKGKGNYVGEVQQSAAIVHTWYKIYCNALHLPKSEKTICLFDVNVSCKNWKRGNWVLRTHCWKKKRPQSLPQWKWLLDQKPSSSPIFVIIVTIIIIIFLFESWKQVSNGASVWRRKTLSRHGIKSDLYKKYN